MCCLLSIGAFAGQYQTPLFIAQINISVGEGAPAISPFNGTSPLIIPTQTTPGYGHASLLDGQELTVPFEKVGEVFHEGIGYRKFFNIYLYRDLPGVGLATPIEKVEFIDAFGGKFRPDFTWPVNSRNDFIVVYNSFYLDEFPLRNFTLRFIGEQGEVVNQLKVNVPSKQSECVVCQSGVCVSLASIGSVDFAIPLGGIGVSDTGDVSNALLRFYSEDVVNPGYTKVSVEKGPSASVTVVNGSAPLVKTITAGDVQARIEKLGAVSDPNAHQDANRFQIRVSNEPSNFEAGVFRTVVVENIVDSDSLMWLQLTETTLGKTVVTSYANPSGDIWIMDRGDGLQRERKETTISGTDEIERVTVSMRKAELDGNGDPVYEVISDTKSTKSEFSWGMEIVEIVSDPDGASPRTISYEYYDNGEESGTNGVNSTAGAGRIKQMTSPTGAITEHFYYEPSGGSYDLCHVELMPLMGQNGQRQTRTYTAIEEGTEPGSTLSTTLIEEWVGTYQISKAESVRESFEGTSTTTSRQYTDASNYLESVSVESATSFTNRNPDGTGISRTTAGDTVNGFITTTTHSGYWTVDQGEDVLEIVSTSIRITNKAGEIIDEQTTLYNDQGQNALVSGRVATQIDEYGRVLEYTHASSDPEGDFTTEFEYGCCGLSRAKDRAGVETFFTRDLLDRVTKTNRLGVTVETVYDGRTTSTHRYEETVDSGGLPSSSQATAANELRRIETNVFGEVAITWGRSAADGAMLPTNFTTQYNVGSGIGHRITAEPPMVADDNSVQPQLITDSYLDGNVALKSGNMQAAQGFEYGADGDGAWVKRFLLDGGTRRMETTDRYDFAGRLVKRQYASDADNNGTNDFSTIEYNALGQVSKTVDPDGVTTLYAYDEKGDLFQRAVDVNGNGQIDTGIDRVTESDIDLDFHAGTGDAVIRETISAYYGNGGSVTKRDITRSEITLGGTRSWNAVVSSPSQELVAASTTEFSGDGDWTVTTTSPDGVSSLSTYNEGRLKKTELKDATGAALYSMTRGFDGLNRPQLVNDSRVSGTATIGYLSDMVDVVTTATDAGGRTTSFSYDARGRQTEVNRPDTLDAGGATLPNVTTTSYHIDGTVAEVDGGQVYRQAYTYDYAKRPETLTTYGTQTAVTRWLYDTDRGWLTGKRHNSPTPGSGTGPSFTYTPGGRVKTRTWARSSGGNPIVTTYLYGSAGGSVASDLDSVTYSDSTPGYAVTARDLLGRVTAMNDVAGDHSFTFTDLGSLDVESITGTGVLSGTTTDYGHDALGRQTSMEIAQSGTPYHSLDYSYDAAGRMNEVTGNGLGATYLRDPSGQRVTQLSLRSDDGNGGLQTMLANIRRYDGLNRLDSTAWNATEHVASGTKALSYHGYQYNALDQRTRADLLDGTFWDFGYDNCGGVTRAEHKESGGTKLAGQQFGYSYDGIGNRTAASDGTSASALPNGYTPGVLNQYSQVGDSGTRHVLGKAPTTSAVTVNSAATTRQGEWFSSAIVADNSSGSVWQSVAVSDGTATVNGSLFVPAASVTPQYDADGNLTSDGRWSYACDADNNLFTWDAENRLTGMETTTAALAAGVPYQRWVYIYDSNGRRIVSKRYDSAAAVTPDAVEKAVYDGWNRVAELDGNNAVLRTFAWGLDLSDSIHGGGGTGGLLWVHDATHGKHFFGYDGNGNVALTVDAVTGVPSAAYDYDPFGRVIRASGTYAQANRYRFSTKQQGSGGFYDYGYRWLDPLTGRWLSRDPIEENGGLNLYGFLGNDGINAWDFLGLEILSVWDDNENDDPNKWNKLRDQDGNGAPGLIASRTQLSIAAKSSYADYAEPVKSYDDFFKTVKEYHDKGIFFDKILIFGHGSQYDKIEYGGEQKIGKDTLLPQYLGKEKLERLKKLLPKDTKIILYGCSVGKNQEYGGLQRGKSVDRLRLQELANMLNATIIAWSHDTKYPLIPMPSASNVTPKGDQVTIIPNDWDPSDGSRLWPYKWESPKKPNINDYNNLMENSPFAPTYESDQ